MTTGRDERPLPLYHCGVPLTLHSHHLELVRLGTIVVG
jgi:hypothetical protein